jgi:cation diffusion facilitator family transporter
MASRFEMAHMHTSAEDLAGHLKGERLARTSVWILVALGIIEVGIGQFAGSIGLTADGIDSISDGFVSLLVWLGLRMSRKAPDEKFHFGYYKVESFVAFVTAIGLMAVGVGILYRSYLGFLNPQPIALPGLVLAVLLVAGTICLYRAFRMGRIAKKFALSSLKLDANNAIKDGAASFLVFFTVLASSLGFHYMDAIGGMIIGVFVLFVSYVVVKETALVLLDACHNPELVEEIRGIVEGNAGVIVKDVLLRRVGPYIHSEIHIEANSTMTLGKLDQLKSSIETAVREKLADIRRVVIMARASLT